MKAIKNLILICLVFLSVACVKISEAELQEFAENLSFETADDANLEGLARDLLALINKERVAAGLNELIPDDGLDQNCDGVDAESKWLGCSSIGPSKNIGFLGCLLIAFTMRRRQREG